MANIDRVKKAIAVMTRVRDREDNLNMRFWQVRSGLGILETEQELHTCGTAACFAGWLAVSPEFQADGGEVAADGRPLFQNEEGARAIARYLEISFSLADVLCLTSIFIEAGLRFYGAMQADVTPQMIIDKLQEIIDNG